VPKIASALQIADFSRRAPSFWRPTRGRQRLRDLERLRQPLLAGALLRRHGRRHRRPVLRRSTLRGIGARHPAAARRRARARLGRRPRRGGGGRVGQPAHAPRRISATGAASTSPHRTAPRSTNAAPTGFLSSCASTTGPGRGVDDRAREGRTRPGRGSIAYRFHARRASRALTRPTRTDSLPRGPRRRGSRPLTRRRRSTRTATACSATADSTTLSVSTTPSATKRSRSPSSSPAPSHMCSHSARYAD
jgi:hypothetical protein